jgi:transmembrane sensor
MLSRDQEFWTLLENDAFVQWVLNPDTASDHYWETWIKLDIRRSTQVDQARHVLRHLQQFPPTTDKPALSRDIWQGIQYELQTGATTPVRSLRSSKWAWMAAASVVLIVLAGSAFWYSHKVRPMAVFPTERASALAVNTLIECRNQSTTPQKVYLVDGSVVTLGPQSTLSYDRFLGLKTREVTLQGDAFFEIAADPNHPFLVRTRDIVTRVLGTSFRINADPGLEEVHVAVRTGKVSVYKQSDFDNGHQTFCVLLPHQEAVFHKKAQNLAFVRNADAQLLIPPVPEIISWNFDDVPVATILDQLENMYHIRILYNKDNLQECRLTTSLQEEKLEDKLDIICKAINATHRTQDDAIVIDGGHCQ